ncbi:hypothetical protein GGI12_004398 [Dipsacomyces acuminosporus]|nr:hypothetical protein GGI12_004398 [Dipsacomyces acuminosporus]
MDARAWRITPVGIDDLHRRYWLLCNNRLYRETPRRIAGVLLGDDEQETDEAKDTGNDTLLRKHNDGDKCSSSDTPALRRRSTRISAQMAAAEAEAKVKLEAGADEAVELPSAEDIELSDPPRHRMREEDGDLWELVCSTANDWSSFPQTFIRSKSKNERALYRALSAVAPEIASALHSAARRRHMQVAVAYRKRSSRIATKELHSQEELHRQAVLQHRLDEQYGLASGRRMSKRLRSQIGNEPSTSDSESYMDQHQVLAKDRHVRAQRRATARLQAMEDAAIAQSLRKAGKQSASASATEDESDDPEDWMFSCSCGKSGHNYDDGRAMTACEKCGVWRHLGCALRGEAQRIGKEIDEDDWESIHYVCPQCIGSSNQVS